MQDGFMINLHCDALKNVGFTDRQANAILLCISDMIKAVKELPRLDLVRCGECKHKMQALSTEQGATSCELIRGTFYEDFFCKCGERRADGDTVQD